MFKQANKQISYLNLIKGATWKPFERWGCKLQPTAPATPPFQSATVADTGLGWRHVCVSLPKVITYSRNPMPMRSTDICVLLSDLLIQMCNHGLKASSAVICVDVDFIFPLNPVQLTFCLKINLKAFPLNVFLVRINCTNRLKNSASGDSNQFLPSPWTPLNNLHWE